MTTLAITIATTTRTTMKETVKVAISLLLNSTFRDAKNETFPGFKPKSASENNERWDYGHVSAEFMRRLKNDC
jgi:hypothetical protein